jgi:Cu(I)/Ag(I) efflux system membrane fusion protein/cobalt-zinc-cadmium efflux system membrane fusion protein
MTRSRRSLIAAIVLVVLVVVAAALYAIRDRLPLRSRGHAAMVTTAPPPPSSAPEAQTDAPPRGDVTIDPQRQQLIGVRLASVTREPIAGSVRTTGVVRYDETRMADVNVKLDGWIRDLYVDYTGQPIQRGQPLFTLYSPDLLATQNEYLLALKTREQMQTSQVADAREYADRMVEAARQRLALWDLPSEELATLERTRMPREAITFRSPVSGYVLEKTALKGMHVMPGQTLYKVADLSVVWVEADVYEQELAFARVGQAATVTLDAYPGESFLGRAIYIYPFVEENTRTVKVRFQFANRGSRLKPGMFANVEMQGTGGAGLTVPADAVLDSGKQQVVFVAEGDGRFTPRSVKIGRRLGDRTQILEGVKEGEQVAVGANFFLDSESQLRAGLQNYESTQPAGTQPASTGPAPNITFRTTSDPPKTGENVFEVTVKDPMGQPVTDADVSVQLFMPAMPTMNMPAMRNETKLAHVGGGLYRGPGQVMMAGRWDVTVTVAKDGKPLGRKQLALAAR